MARKKTLAIDRLGFSIYIGYIFGSMNRATLKSKEEQIIKIKVFYKELKK